MVTRESGYRFRNPFVVQGNQKTSSEVQCRMCASNRTIVRHSDWSGYLYPVTLIRRSRGREAEYSGVRVERFRVRRARWTVIGRLYRGRWTASDAVAPCRVQPRSFGPRTDRIWFGPRLYRRDYPIHSGEQSPDPVESAGLLVRFRSDSDTRRRPYSAVRVRRYGLERLRS